MAKMKRNIGDLVSGWIGNLVFYTQKGVNYMGAEGILIQPVFKIQHQALHSVLQSPLWQVLPDQYKLLQE